MDFFARQDKARRNTKLLVVYFVLAVTFICVSVYFVALLVFGGLEMQSGRGEPPKLALWEPRIFAFSIIGALAIILGGSAYRIASLSGGGGAVARSLGGRLLRPDATEPHERKLLNVVEEMALASGVPVPEVYLLDHEMGINAFAAGFTPSDAAVGVTRGCVQKLTRDELQGVIAHEFSHILNGDMRLNLRLMGIIFGIVCLTVAGRILLRTRGRKNPLPLLGLALILIGWVGVFFGRLIQAAVSRQREFLADSAAVQFTRNPHGLAGALKKIGANSFGSQLNTEHAEEASHMFFGDGMGRSLFGAFATHPPLPERIRAIEPSWDGKFPKMSKEDAEAVVEKVLRKPPAGVADVLTGKAGTRHGIPMAAVLPALGQPTPMHLRYAEEFRDALPERVRLAARESLGARAVIFALLLSTDAAQRERELEELGRRTSPALRTRLVALADEVAGLAVRARLPLVDLALPALRQMSAEEFTTFDQALDWLIHSDEKLELFEWVLQKVIHRHLASHFSGTKAPVVQFYSIKPLADDCAVLLSALARLGAADEEAVAKAFARGAPYLRAGDVPIALRRLADCGVDQINATLDRLAQAVPQIKKNLLEACVQTIGADGLIQEGEAEVLRAIGDTLDCPLPPFVKMGA